MDGFYPPESWDNFEGGYVPLDDNDDRVQFWDDLWLAPDEELPEEPDYPEVEQSEEDAPPLSPYDLFGDDDHIVILDLTNVDPKDLRGQRFASILDAINWLLETKLLSIGRVVDLGDSFFGVAMDDTPRKKRKSRRRRKKRK